MSGPFLIGVDVGTGSARAGVFDMSGVLLGVGKHDIEMWREGPHIVEQSSDDIWQAVAFSVRTALDAAKVAPDRVAGLGVDAACSMAVLDREMQPLAVNGEGKNKRNVIVWMDHRARDQAARINDMGHAVLDYVGGVISPEMQTPKLLWLKENLPSSYEAAGQFFDLADFLTWKATGSLARSACTVTCKWTYLAHENRWDASYFEAIGLGDLAQEGFTRIGQKVVGPGTPLCNGLSAAAADDLGLKAGTPVGAGLIDAHAGGIGTLGAAPVDTMAYVFGTSACTMSSSAAQTFVPGVWGPYFNAMVPGLWLSEGGQSAAGAAIDQVLALHPAREKALNLATTAGHSLPDHLASALAERAPDGEALLALVGDRMVVPEFNGNRAPFADPHAKGLIAGLTLDQSVEDLIAFYGAGLLGIGYGLRQILDAQTEHGVKPTAVVISGGAGEAAIVKQVLADAAQIEIFDTECHEPVLLGAAMLGALASGQAASLTSAMSSMTRRRQSFSPRCKDRHDKRMSTFRAFQQQMALLRKT